MNKTIRNLIFLASFAACPLVLSAQVQATNGSIQGSVTDAGGGLIPGAAVEADETDTGTVHNAVTDGSGQFSFPSLPPGGYVVKISKPGFATVLQKNLSLTVGSTISLKPALKVATNNETVVVNSAPLIDLLNVSSTTTLNEATIATTPVLGRKFEDLLTLTPGVSIVQGPDGDEININGQRGIFNNISLDGGDYNNGFFGEQSGGQRAAVDITLEAVKEFQVVASGANAEFGRTGGGVINVITKSGTNKLHGSAFEYQRLEALTGDTSDGTPLTNFHREQFGGSLGGAIKKDKLFFFGAGEGIKENLQRANLSKYNASSLFANNPCSITNPVFGSNITDAEIDANGDCQRLVLLNFYKTTFNDDEGTPIDHKVSNGAFFGRVDWNITPKNLFYVSYNFDYSNNPNQTFDVSTYGRTANGIEGPSHISTLNTNLITTLNDHMLNEAHVTYGYETRPRSPIDPNAVPDTGIGFTPSFRFGQPFFLGPGSSETFYHYELKDNFTLTRGNHSIKFGGDFLYSHNVQVFDGFALGRYIFGSTSGFLHYASAGAGNGSGVLACDGGDVTYSTACGGGSPLLLYLQDTGEQPGETVQQSGYSNISDKLPGFYAQDTWKVLPRLTLNYGLRWEAQYFPQLTIPVSLTSYGTYVNNPAFPDFPSNGTLPNQTKQFQPRFGFVYDVFGTGKTSLRGSAGIFNARQNQLTEVGAITTNGYQQAALSEFSGYGNPTYPGTLTLPPAVAGPANGAAVTVFDKNYHNPRIYTYNVGLDQQVKGDFVAFVDATLSKGVYLTTFLDPNVGAAVLPGQVIPNDGGNTYSGNADTVCYTSGSTDTCTYANDFSAPPAPFSTLGAITNTASRAKSLYRGITFGVRKPMSHHYQFEVEYTYSVDKDTDSNERDPFTFRYANIYNLGAEYSNSDRDERHKFNAYGLGDLPFGFKANVRVQSHTAEPETDQPNPLVDGVPTAEGAPCSYTNSATRFVNGIDCGRNHLRKDNGYFTLDFGVARPFHFHDGRYTLEPRAEVFNTTNSKNLLNPLSSPALFDFSGFLRTGVGDPLQAQLALRFSF